MSFWSLGVLLLRQNGGRAGRSQYVDVRGRVLGGCSSSSACVYRGIALGGRMEK
jgi:hypothetical protein